MLTRGFRASKWDSYRKELKEPLYNQRHILVKLSPLRESADGVEHMSFLGGTLDGLSVGLVRKEDKPTGKRLEN